MRKIEAVVHIAGFLGGLGLFIYGVQTASDGLQKFAARRFKEILQSLTNRPFLAALFGVFMTVVFQSSVATTVLVVEFVNAGLMRLAQALGILLGSALGTSIAIQLLTFNMLPIALAIIFIGFLFNFWVKKKRWKNLGQGLIGFGIIFVGMSQMKVAAAPIKNVPAVTEFLSHLGSQPFLAIVVGIALTALLQGGAAMFAVLISLAEQNVLPFEAIIPLVIGSHIGGTVMALFSSLTAQKMDAKRAAIANTGYKVVAGLLILPFMSQFASLVEWTSSNIARQVVNAHLLMSLLMLIFLPFNEWIAKALVRFVPDKKKEEKEVYLHYITPASLELPTVALKQVFKEIIALGEYIEQKMIKPMPQALLADKEDLAMEIARAEINVDWYYRHISRFLNELNSRSLTNEQSSDSMNAQFIVKELEYIGDAFRAMVGIRQKLEQNSLRLRPEDWERVSELYEYIQSNFSKMLTALKQWDKDIGGEVILSHPEVIRIQRQLQFETFAEVKETQSPREEEKLRFGTLDLLNLAYSINEHTVNICQVVLGII